MATIKDIAKKADVSTATVSRIINGKGEAKPETIARVMKIVKELDYQPNKMAKSLRQRKSDLIAIIVPNLTNPFFAELANAIEIEANKHHLRVILCNTNDSREKVEYFLGNIVDNYALGAVICTLKVTENDLEYLEDKGIHTVTIDRAYFEHRFSSINIDQLNGAFIATTHLIERNARKIVLICGPKSEKMSTERIKGYQLALKSAGLTSQKIVYGDYSLKSGYEIIEELLNKDYQFDGIHASNDQMALGALRCCLDNGLTIPKEVKIVGNDNLAIDHYSNPRLTSLSQMHEKVSQSVIKELRESQKKGHQPQKIVLSPELFIRESS